MPFKAISTRHRQEATAVMDFSAFVKGAEMQPSTYRTRGESWTIQQNHLIKIYLGSFISGEEGELRIAFSLCCSNFSHQVAYVCCYYKLILFNKWLSGHLSLDKFYKFWLTLYLSLDLYTNFQILRASRIKWLIEVMCICIRLLQACVHCSSLLVTCLGADKHSAEVSNVYRWWFPVCVLYTLGPEEGSSS